MCEYCEKHKRGCEELTTPFICNSDSVLRIEKNEPYVGDYGFTLYVGEDNVFYGSEAINFCPMCGRKLTNDQQKGK